MARRFSTFVLLLSPACLELDPEITATRAESSVTLCHAVAADDGCAELSDGRPQACFVASALGGRDFCVDACDATEDRTDPARTCLASGVAPLACDPGEPSCPVGLECYRTDLLDQKGICTDIPVCEHAADCPKSRPICGGELLRELYPGLPVFTDHLPCFQSPCNEKSCDGFCLRSKVTDQKYLPDICVPMCDSSGHCPPNFYCEEAAGTGYPAMCVPGLPGYRCASDDDCLVASCLPTGAGFSVCSISCTRDEDCSLLAGTRRPEVCAKLEGAASGICVSAAPFEGEACRANHAEDCPTGKRCFWYSAGKGPQALLVSTDVGTGECRYPCDSDQSCGRVAGLPHVCLGRGQGGCHPAEFGVPCDSIGPLADCIGELVCHELAAPEPRSGATAICTLPCGPDAAKADETGDLACRAHVLTANGFCAQDGFCRPSRSLTDSCSREGECGTLHCATDADGNSTCQGRGPGESCTADSDCASSACSSQTSTCISAP